MTALRVIDTGEVGALRSQALWHGLAQAMTPGADPVLSFCRPADPYVGIGYHRRLDEVDRAACARLGLPVLRRQIGGGPVYLDSDQLFFQLSLPASSAPAGVGRIYDELLGPAITALRELGVEAEMAGANDIVAGGRKISGTGAGQIGDGVVVVGNVMFAFPFERMAEVLQLPDESMRADCLDLMRSHLGTLPHVDESALKESLARAYGAALGRTVQPDRLRPDEETAVGRWETRLNDPDWLTGPTLPPARGRQVKIRAGTFIYDGAAEGVSVRVRVEDGTIRAARVTDPSMNGSAQRLAEALLGASARHAELAERLDGFEHDGERVLSALTPGLVVR